MTSSLPLTKTAKIPGQAAEIDKQYSLADIDPVSGRWEGMFVGPPGVGKTVAAATLPAPFRWLDADGGLKSVKWAWKEGLTTIKDPATDLIAYRPYEEGYSTTAVAFDKMCDILDHWFSEVDVDKWKTLVVDSATTINEWVLLKGLDVNLRLPTTKKPLSRSHEINLTVEARIVTGQQDYKSAQAFFMGWLENIRIQCAKHDKNLVLICHEWTETDEDGGVIAYQPNLIGQLRTRVAKDFDDVWYFHMYTTPKGNEVKVQVHKDPRHAAKTRWGGFLPKEIPADFRVITKMVQEYFSS